MQRRGVRHGTDSAGRQSKAKTSDGTAAKLSNGTARLPGPAVIVKNARQAEELWSEEYIAESDASWDTARPSWQSWCWEFACGWLLRRSASTSCARRWRRRSTRPAAR